MRTRPRSAVYLLLAALMLSLAACGQGTKATTMHLKRAEGTIAVSDGAGKDVPVLENLGLYSGYGVDTSSESYAWINLDDVKLTKLDQQTEIAIQKDGKTLEIEVKSGSLFFNVTEPLAEDETLNIRASTMLIGVRGTCGWVEARDSFSRVYLLEGKVECTAGDQGVQVNAGEMAELTADGELMVKPFMVEDVASFVRPEVEDREELTANLPVSQFKSREYYVDESELPSATKELLHQIRAAVDAEDWNEVGELAYATLEWENIAGEHITWTERERQDLHLTYTYRIRYFYSEYDGFRFRISNHMVIYPDNSSSRYVQLEIRPELGQGCCIYYGYVCDDFGNFDHFAAMDFGTGQCENYNWTGSFRELKFNGLDLDENNLEEPYIIELYRANRGWPDEINGIEEYFWND